MGRDSVGWPSAAVAVGLLGMITAVAVAAIIKYDTVDDALKIWTAMTTVIGVVTGAFVTYFFTKSAVAEAKTEANTNMTALTRLAGRIEPATFNRLLAEDPLIARAFTRDQP